MQAKIDTLKDWFVYERYWDGVKLYQQYGTSGFLKATFAENEDDVNHAFLVKELSEILAEAEAQQVEKVKNYPKVLQDQVEVSKRLLDERSALKAELRVLHRDGAAQERLKEVAFKILALNDQVRDVSDKERFFGLLGHLPESTDYATENGEYLLKRLHTVRTYVSRYKDGNQAKLEQYSSELFELERKLSELGLLTLEYHEKAN